MALRVEIVDSLGSLLEPLAELLRTPTGALLMPELVAIPAIGVRLWLAEELARRLGTSGASSSDGITTNIEFVFIGGLIGRALGGRQAHAAWQVDPLTFRVLQVIADEPQLVPQNRRAEGLLPAARQIADLLDRYHVHRPLMIQAWANNSATLTPADGRDTGPALAPQDQWQFEVWRRVRLLIGEPSPPERAADALAGLRQGVVPAGFPERIAIAGLAAIAPFHLQVLQALACAIDVHVWLLHPSPALAQRTQPLLGNLAQRMPLPYSAHPARNNANDQLLASWARPAHDMQVLLAAAGIAPKFAPVPAQPASLRGPLLARMQQALRLDAVIPQAALLDAGDRSVQIHCCHGEGRQAEVLREVLLHTFTELPGLDPRDVLVLAPNIVAMAPVLAAVFQPDTADTAQALHLPFIVADRALRRTHEVADALSALLSLLASRCTTADVLAFAARKVVQRRLQVDDAVVAGWGAWAANLQVRWGLNASQRTKFGLPAGLLVHTWQQALDRLVYGAVVPDAVPTRELGGVVPAPAVDVADIPAVGALAALLARLSELEAETRRPRPVGAWCELLQAALTSLCAVEQDDESQLNKVLERLAELGDCAALSEVPVGFSELRVILAADLTGEPGRQQLRSGVITATSLVPLRSVPYRVICIAGFDEAALATGEPDGDDLRQRPVLIGDSDPRAELRQALLDAVLAAGERLIITCTGRTLGANAAIPFATPLAELVELCGRVAAPPQPATEAKGVLQAIRVEHPRHALNAANFLPGQLGTAGAFGHLPAALFGAQLLRDHTTDGADPLAEYSSAVDRPPGSVIALDDLISFCKNPLSHFVKRVHGIRLSDFDSDQAATLPLELGRWDGPKLAGDLLQRMRLHAGDAAAQAHAAAEWAAAVQNTGQLPLGAYGQASLAELRALVDEIVRQCGAKQRPLVEGQSVPVQLQLSDGRSIAGAVPGVHPGPGGSASLVQVFCAANKPAEMMAMWVRMLALCAAGGPQLTDAWSIGMSTAAHAKSYAYRAKFVAAGFGQPDALAALEELVLLYDEGCAHRRPMFGGAAEKLTEGRGKASKVFEAFLRRIKSYHVEQLAYGERPRFKEIYPSGGESERFFRELFGLRERTANIRNDRARAAARQRKPAK